MANGIEQLRAEQRERWRNGERVPAEEYLARTGAPGDEERVLEVIYQEILLREEEGESPHAEEYQERFPCIADRVRQLFEIHSVFSTAAPAPVAEDEAVPSTVVGPTGVWPPHRHPVPPPQPLPTIPGYEVIEELGQGGMAVVYKARQPRLDRLVAIKVLPPASASDPAFAERFGREARVLARLGHPNIVGVHDFGQAGELYYLVMEYVEGVNLRQALRDGSVRPHDALKLMEQLCDALQHAHDQGVIHRDIKPENILLDRHGRAKVADFGLAKLLRGGSSAALTGAQQVMGTWHYMAPEQFRAARDVDHRADLYSLGVTMYEMLTGELPGEQCPPPSKRAAVDPRLDAVVLRALEKEPGRRQQSAAAIKADIEALRPSSGENTDPAGRRIPSYLRWVVLPAMLLLALLLIGSCAGIARAPEGSQAALLLCMNGFLTWTLGFLVASLVWLFRQRDEGTVVSICGIVSLVVALWGIIPVSKPFLDGPAPPHAPAGALFAAWAVAAPVVHGITSIGWFAGGVGLLLWRGWGRRLVVATCWLGLVYFALEVPTYAAYMTAGGFEEFSLSSQPGERTPLLSGLALGLVLALVVVIRLGCTLGQLVLLRRAAVARAFSADGERQAARIGRC